MRKILYLDIVNDIKGKIEKGILKPGDLLPSENEMSERRLGVMEKTTDGFKIAEEDLKLRNSGEIFGTKQSGVSDLLLTDIIKNVREIKYIRDFVLEYLEKNNGLVENEYLKRDIYNKFQEKNLEN